MPTLADIYSLIDSTKRRGADFIQNPGASLQQIAGYGIDRTNAARDALYQATEEEGIGYGPKTKALAQSMAQSYNPVGMTGFVRGDKPIQSAVVKIGDKLFMGRTHGDALNRAIYEGVVRKQGGKYIYPKDQDLNMDLFLTNDGKLIDRWGAFFAHDIGASETAIEKNIMQNNPAWSASIEQFKRGKL